MKDEDFGAETFFFESKPRKRRRIDRRLLRDWSTLLLAFLLSASFFSLIDLVFSEPQNREANSTAYVCRLGVWEEVENQTWQCSSTGEVRHDCVRFSLSKKTCYTEPYGFSGEERPRLADTRLGLSGDSEVFDDEHLKI